MPATQTRVNWRTTPLFLSRYQSEIKTTAEEYGVDPALVRAVIHAESAFNEKALSPVGAQGLMQLMPGTALEVGVQNAMLAGENIRGGVTYLAKMLERFKGDTKLATAAYNAGPGAVTRYGGIPLCRNQSLRRARWHTAPAVCQQLIKTPAAPSARNRRSRQPLYSDAAIRLALPPAAVVSTQRCRSITKR